MDIVTFNGPYWFLSNFYPCIIKYETITYSTVEHAYQASKTLDFSRRLEIAKARRPAQAKFLGRCVVLRPEWDDIKVSIMEELLERKFADQVLMQKLLDTGDATLIEGNWWGDEFWGVYKGRGKNHLGKLLMKIRKKYAREHQRR